MVTLAGRISDNSSTISSEYSYGQLPAGFRPAAEVETMIDHNIQHSANIMLSVDATGAVRLKSSSHFGDVYQSFLIVFPAA